MVLTYIWAFLMPRLALGPQATKSTHERSGDISGRTTSIYMSVLNRNAATLAHILPKYPWHQEQLLLKRFFISSSPGPCITGWVWIIFMFFLTTFQKSHSPNQPKYLMGAFSKISSHLKQQLLLKRFFYTFKNWNEHYWCIQLVFSIY
jgi:hypothetical protein